MDTLKKTMEENNASTNKNKEVLKKYTELWDKIKNLIEKIDGRSSEYEQDFMKIKFNSDDNLTLKSDSYLPKIFCYLLN